MTAPDLAPAEDLKFDLLAEGMIVSEGARARLEEATAQRALTPADYASTSGLILVLDGDVWVNAPIIDHNANFVFKPDHVLDLNESGELVVRSRGRIVSAQFWVPPLLHEEKNPWDENYTSYCFTHTDRVRVSPIEGCAFFCQFCDLPYEFAYRRKLAERLVQAVRAARDDKVQPARHVLISGGTPRDEDGPYLVEAFAAILEANQDVAVDIMMAPVRDALPLEELDTAGLNEVSINLELWNLDVARRYMRMKYEQGRDYYLSFIVDSVETMGVGRVRSMLMVGLEPMESTLEGVAALAERGCIPVLSPFRPDPSTPLRAMPTPTARMLKETYLRSREITQAHGIALGPACIPCSHNTMTLAASGAGDANHSHGEPLLVR